MQWTRSILASHANIEDFGLMDLFDQMRTFVRIVDTGRLGAAAKSRGMSLAAVSRQLSALERDLGVTLVVRSTRQLAITEHGRRWYQYCASTLSSLATARADMADGEDAHGKVVVSAPVSIGLTILAADFDAVTREYPRLSIELRLQDHAIDLLAEGVDIAIRVGTTLPDSTSVVAHRLATFRRALLASSGYLRKRGTPKHPDDLAQHDLLAHTQASPSFTRWQFQKREQTVEIYPQSRLESTSPIMLREWALGGAGITLIPDWAMGDLKRIMTDWVTPEITAYAIHRVEARSLPRIRVVIDAIAKAVNNRDSASLPGATLRAKRHARASR